MPSQTITGQPITGQSITDQTITGQTMPSSSLSSSLKSLFTMMPAMTFPSPIDVIKRPAYYLARPIKKVPKPIHKQLIKQVLGEALKTAVNEGDFDCLINRKVQITLTDADYRFSLGLDSNKQFQIQLDQEVQAQPDTEIKLNSDAVIKILTKTVDPDTLFFQRQLIILGDMDLGHEVKNTLDAIEHESLPKLAQWIINNLVPHIAKAQTLSHEVANALLYQAK